MTLNKQSFFLLTLLMLPLPVLAQSLQDQINAVDAAVTVHKADEAAAQKREQARVAAKNAAREQERKRRLERENKLLDLELEDRSLDVDTKRARAKRTNEFIDQELKRQAVETDAIRDVSSGISENLKSQGRAAEAQAKK